MIASLAAALCVAVWAWLLFAHGGFWRADQTDEAPSPEHAEWPAVTAIVPARDEVELIGRAIASLLAQDYPGRFNVILVDDGSRDGTAEAARAAALAAGRPQALQILAGAPPPAGWTGKLWALAQGTVRAGEAELLWFTDADIVHAPDNLRRLSARAQAGDLALTSLMAELRCESFAERLLVPAFVLFFQMLYPFRWANRPDRATAAAAGGCMLVRASALAAAGGLAAIRTSIIDDCALAAAIKRHGKRRGRIWIGLTHRARSLRPYPTVGSIGRMVARSAFAQLDYSPWLLAGTLAGLLITFALGPALVVIGPAPARLGGLMAWAAMAAAFQPMLRFYRASPVWGPLLPLIATLYAAFTLASAVDVWRGRGGMWKGRPQALARPA